ncbi:MAG: universal stress protein [Planctomycetes bacterium]|nr:universal stress protein [Planctomycetota bacterium]
MLKRILYVVNTTKEALEAATFVAEMAVIADAQIIAFGVVDTSAAQRLMRATGEAEAEIVVRLEEDTWHYLYDVEDTCKGVGAKIVLQQDEGFPDARIASAARKFKADLVVLPRTRRTGAAQSRLEKSIMSLIERLECPVLVV